jgi:predicted phage terminase large subunit-like protein
LDYDDLVTKESVSTPEQIKKVTEALELSYNLGAQGGKRRFIGTRYHAHDTYKTIMDRGTVIPRIKPATDNGKMDGKSVFMPQEILMEKRRDQGPYTFGSQMLQNPVADKSMGFKEEWLKFYEALSDTRGWNKYIIVDPASKRKKTSDYTVMEVIGLAPDGNYYLLDAIRDRLNLTQRAAKLFELHRKHQPTAVGYEEYGAQADVEHIEYEMEKQNYRFDIIRLGGSMAKEDRILRMVPVYEQRRFWMPKRLHYVDYEGKAQDYIHNFIEDEYKTFPVAVHDDMSDCRSRILDPDLGAKFPKIASPKKPAPRPYSGSSGWMG